MKILLVNPQFPDTFWSFRHALKFISKKASFPPLGLLTVAAMLPEEWEKKLVDMNATTLTDTDIKWADYVLIGAMVVQQKSALEVIDRCSKLDAKIVAGGPYFTVAHSVNTEFENVDHLVLDEAETTLPPFLEDLEKGCAKPIYTSTERPDIAKTPIPLWSLIDRTKYSSLNIQYSRGCPFNCEFCDIIILNGHMPRTKTKEQMLAELEAIYEQGWRGGMFIVDDNFIGNKRKLKAEILPAIIQWMKERKYPFIFLTEVSLNLADDEELMHLMIEAGFDTVFIGIESPHEESLTECNKIPNKTRDLAASVKKIQNHGFHVLGGFIVGFDSDPLSIFKSQINFIQKSGIVTAMVGLLIAPPKTRLYKRLEKENRILPGGSGDNTDFSINFIPKMNYEVLVNGYKHILDTIYSPKQYCERIGTFLKEYKPHRKRRATLQFCYVLAFFKSLWILGVKEKGRWYYWKLLTLTLLKHPKAFPLSVTFAIQAFHFRKVFEKFSNISVKDMPGITKKINETEELTAGSDAG
ncbi:MAG: B12-binding domain-containing radical SAM protein [Dehalococcoidales bacterium]|nr:B12-binding domain-containing radical SAM protein [Dehalococcoidales bacterium]